MEKGTTIKAVIFDMDGTVVEVPYDWKKIKKDLQTQGQPILSYIQSLNEPQRSKKWQMLERYEEEATSQARLKKGIKRFLLFLRKKGIKRALVTNNSRKNVDFLMNKFKLDFDVVLSRESGLWKPSGEPFLFVLKFLGIAKEECCVIGDSHFDIKAAAEAGIPFVFVLSGKRPHSLSGRAEIFPTVSRIKKKLEKLI